MGPDIILTVKRAEDEKLGMILQKDFTIKSIAEGSPTARAGLTTEMKIVAVNGKTYETLKEMGQAMSSGGLEFSVTAKKLNSSPDKSNKPVAVGPYETTIKKSAGANPGLTLGSDMSVINLIPDGHAATAGVIRGMILLQVDGKIVLSPQEAIQNIIAAGEIRVKFQMPVLPPEGKGGKKGKRSKGKGDEGGKGDRGGSKGDKGGKRGKQHMQGGYAPYPTGQSERTGFGKGQYAPPQQQQQQQQQQPHRSSNENRNFQHSHHQHQQQHQQQHHHHQQQFTPRHHDEGQMQRFNQPPVPRHIPSGPGLPPLGLQQSHPLPPQLSTGAPPPPPPPHNISSPAPLRPQTESSFLRVVDSRFPGIIPQTSIVRSAYADDDFACWAAKGMSELQQELSGIGVNSVYAGPLQNIAKTTFGKGSKSNRGWKGGKGGKKSVVAEEADLPQPIQEASMNSYLSKLAAAYQTQ